MTLRQWLFSIILIVALGLVGIDMYLHGFVDGMFMLVTGSVGLALGWLSA